MTNATSMLGALGDPMRQAIFERLAGGPQAVGALASELPVSRPAVSQHLKVLKDVGLVTDERDGTRRLYRVDPAGLAVLRTYLDQQWERSLEAFGNAIEAEGEQGDRND
jgi:DNA-binding transcriptional ArsR family regulator